MNTLNNVMKQAWKSIIRKNSADEVYRMGDIKTTLQNKRHKDNFTKQEKQKQLHKTRETETTSQDKRNKDNFPKQET